MCLFGFAMFGEIAATDPSVKSSQNPLLKDGKTKMSWKQKQQLGTHCVSERLYQTSYDSYRFRH